MDEVGEAMIELLHLNIRQDRIYIQYTSILFSGW